MGETIQQRGRHLGVAKDAWPFAERQIGGDDCRSAFIEPADEMEEQLPAGLREGQIAEFVENDEVHPGEVIGDASLTPGARFRLQPIDEIDDIEEAPTQAGADAAARDGDGEMRLAGSGRGRDMAPDFWRMKRRSTTPSILWRGRPWRRQGGASCTAASNTSRFA